MTRVRDAVASGIAWGTVGRVLQVVAQFAATATLARLLLPEDFGIVNMAAVFLAIANALADFGVRSFLIHRPSLERLEIETAKTVSLALGGAVFGVSVLAAWPLAAFYGEPRLIPVVIAQALVYVIAGAAVVPSALVARRLGFRRSAMAEGAGSVTYVAVSVALAAWGGGYWSLVTGRLAASLAGLIVVAWGGGSILPGRASRATAASMARFGGAVTGTGVLTQLDENLDNVVVGRVLGAEPLGLYAVAYNVAALPQRYLAYMVAGVANPVIARADPAALPAALRSYARYQALGPGAMAVALSVLAPEVAALLLGAKWMGAVPLIRVMGLSTAMLAVSTVVGGSLVARGEVRPLFAFHAAKLAATAVGILVGLRFGMIGIAWGFFASNGVALLVGLRLVEVRLRSPGILRAWSGAVALVAVAAVAAWASRSIALAAGAASPVVLAGAGVAYVAALVVGALIAFEDVRRDLRAIRLPKVVRRREWRPGKRG